MIRLFLQGIGRRIGIVYVLKQRHKKRRICGPVGILVLSVLHDPHDFVISASLRPAKTQMLADRLFAAKIFFRERFIDDGDRPGIRFVLLVDTASTQHARPDGFKVTRAHTIPGWRILPPRGRWMPLDTHWIRPIHALHRAIRGEAGAGHTRYVSQILVSLSVKDCELLRGISVKCGVDFDEQPALSLKPESLMFEILQN